MYTIRDRSTVRRDTESLWRFFVDLDRSSYLQWHPRDHLDFRRVHPATTPSGQGQVVYFKERIGGRAFGFTCKVSVSDESRYIEYIPYGIPAFLRLGRGHFKFTPIDNDTSEFEAFLQLGWKLPVLGTALDFLIRRVVDLDALREHIADEGRYIETAGLK